MSLPFADNPDKSSIYNDLKVKKLVDLTADDFDAFRARMDAQGVDGLEDEYRRLLLLGQASNMISYSPVIPDSQLIEAQTFTSAGYRNYITPNKGEVFVITGVSVASVTGLSGSVITEVDINDGTNRVLLIDHSASSSSDYPVIEINQSPIYLMYPNTLRIRCEGTFTSVNDVSVLYCRIN
tara:strand:- start:719 stop:1261 length:543 start_codon:yes stop_codon:yes gene_type:complete